MKSYKNLYTILLSESNRKEAIKSIKHSRRIRKMIKKRCLTDSELLTASFDWICNYYNRNHTPIQIHDGITHKARTIIVPTLEELLVQHCVVNALKPMFCKGMYEHSYASIPHRGVHRGKKTIEKWIRNDPRETKYVLKIDIRHFFDSISHDILKEKLAKYIKDEQMLQLLFTIIDATETGIPLGFYTSQWLSNWLLQDLDHYIKENLGANKYIRYADDIVIFDGNKKKLHRIRIAINQYLEEKLGLEMKKNWQVFLFDYNGRGRDLDFMGFRFFRNRTILRRSIMLRASKKAKRIGKKQHVNIHDIRQMMSYLGSIDCTDTYNMYVKHIKPYANIGRMKNYISKHDEKEPSRIYQKFVNMYS